MSNEKSVIERKNHVITRMDEENPNEELFDQGDKVSIHGRIEADFVFSYEVSGKSFYETRVIVPRNEEKKDFIPIVVPECFLDEEVLDESLTGKWVKVNGSFRSLSQNDREGVRHLKLFLFASEISIYDEKPQESKNKNYIYLKGCLCKKPIYRKTPLGKEITDLFIAVNHPDGKSSYIPCITWFEQARFSAILNVGDHVELYGMIQSRKYFKRFKKDSDEGELKETYEVSVKKITSI